MFGGRIGRIENPTITPPPTDTTPRPALPLGEPNMITDNSINIVKNIINEIADGHPDVIVRLPLLDPDLYPGITAEQFDEFVRELFERLTIQELIAPVSDYEDVEDGRRWWQRLPSLPNLPNLPRIPWPSLPSLPSLPNIPGLPGISNLFDWLGGENGILSRLFEFLLRGLTAAIDLLGELIERLFNGLTRVIRELFGGITGVIREVFDGITDVLGEILEFLQSIPGAIADAIAALFVPENGFITGRIDGIREEVTEKLPFQTLIDQIRELLNVVAYAASEEPQNEVPLIYNTNQTVAFFVNYINPHLGAVRIIVIGLYAIFMYYFNYRQLLFLIRGTSKSNINIGG
jgi:hypothetical protein